MNTVKKIFFGIPLSLWAFPVFAQGSQTVAGIVQKLIREVLQPLVYLLFGLATIIFLWGIIQYVIAQSGDEKKLADAKRVMIWGIIGLFIMSSAWGIVSVLCNFFGTCPGGGGGGYQDNSSGFGVDLF